MRGTKPAVPRLLASFSSFAAPSWSHLSPTSFLDDRQSLINGCPFAFIPTWCNTRTPAHPLSCHPHSIRTPTSSIFHSVNISSLIHRPDSFRRASLRGEWTWLTNTLHSSCPLSRAPEVVCLVTAANEIWLRGPYQSVLIYLLAPNNHRQR